MDALAWFSHSILNFHSTIMLLYGVLAVAGVSIATAQSVEFTRIAHCQRGDGVQYDHTVAVSRHLNMATFTQHRRHHFKLFSGRPHALIRVRCRRWRLLQRHSVPVSTGRVYRSHLRGALLAEIFAVPRFPSPPHTFFFFSSSVSRGLCQVAPAQRPRVAAHGAAQSPPSRPGLCRRSPTWLPARPRSRSVRSI